MTPMTLKTPMTQSAQSDYLTPKEIAEMLKVSVRTIQRTVTTTNGDPNRLKAIRVGQRGLYRVSMREFERWLDYSSGRPKKQGRC
jgi:excisionase family DNA binding protein